MPSVGLNWRGRSMERGVDTLGTHRGKYGQPSRETARARQVGSPKEGRRAVCDDKARMYAVESREEPRGVGGGREAEWEARN